MQEATRIQDNHVSWCQPNRNPFQTFDIRVRGGTVDVAKPLCVLIGAQIEELQCTAGFGPAERKHKGIDIGTYEWTEVAKGRPDRGLVVEMLRNKPSGAMRPDRGEEMAGIRLWSGCRAISTVVIQS